MWRSQSDDAARRAKMVQRQIAGRGVDDPPVLEAMSSVPREEFVPPAAGRRAFNDEPLCIGKGQTISQPYVVALMTRALRLEPGDRVLEIGTGSGYSAAILSCIVDEVFSVECISELAAEAAARLARLGYDKVVVKQGDGTLGWPEHAPYQAIVVTAGGPRVPETLKRQMAMGGRLVMPVGDDRTLQSLLRVTRTAEDRYRTEDLGAVRFVPLLGAEGW
jgi:protein-L-isoaspartate(D-aspartate) O-methyltransferase